MINRHFNPNTLPMTKYLVLLALLLTFSSGHAQHNFWTKSQSARDNSAHRQLKRNASVEVFTLDVEGLKQALSTSQNRGEARRGSTLILSFPDSQGELQQYSVQKASVLHPELSKKYPGISSYTGQGIDEPSSTIRFSLSDQRGFSGMIMSGNSGMTLIDPTDAQQNQYAVVRRSDLDRDNDFTCLLDASPVVSDHKRSTATLKTNDRKLRKYRLALSCNAEYGNIFAGTGTDAEKIANILAQMNITMTRVNGIYERDLGITLEIIANNDQIIYFGDEAKDPWSNEYNATTQQTIDNIIGDANYDIGHNFNVSDGGAAGCIGCVCVSGKKGSGFTGRPDPTGDAFDIDFVAHEMGHQFGGYHVMNTCSRSGENTEVEPGSGSTIMGYAGICTPLQANIQDNSDAYFAYVNIRDISKNIQTENSSGCAEIIDLDNNPPIADAGSDYVIPRLTPFILTGSGQDPDGNESLTYCWEQNDSEVGQSLTNPASNWSQGPMFRSLEGTSNPKRYMPALADVLKGKTSNTWEVLPALGRTLNFSLTVRDNHAGGGQTDDDLMKVTVDGNSGPFFVSDPNTAVTWYVGQQQTITWEVANTDKAPVNCSRVNILMSEDGGLTFPLTLVANTPNDGTESIVVPDNIGSQFRIKIESIGNIFYDISDHNIEIVTPKTCSQSIPGNLITEIINPTDASFSWDVNEGAVFELRYREVGTTNWTTISAGGSSKRLNNLDPESQYELQVRSICSGITSEYSSSITFTTPKQPLVYCPSTSTDTDYERIRQFQLASIDHESIIHNGYSNHTDIFTNLEINKNYTFTIIPEWPQDQYSEGYGIWIDYNHDGDFDDVGETLFSKAPSKDTKIVGSFTISPTAILGNTRLRVSLKYEGVPAPCEGFPYGEVEDYTVNIVPDQTPPTAVSVSLKSSNTLRKDVATIDDRVTLVFTLSEKVSTPTVTIAGQQIIPTGGPQAWTAVRTMKEDDTEGNIGFTIVTEDEVGNSVLITSTTDESLVSFARTITGVEEFVDEVLKVYPVPTSNALNITGLPYHKDGYIQLIDNAGRVVITQPMVNEELQSIDVQALPSGPYTLLIHTNWYSGNRLVIVSR